MTIEERAEKIIQHIESIYGKRTGWVIDFVTSQITQACAEAVKTVKKEQFENGYEMGTRHGFSEAIEKCLLAYKQSGTSEEVERRMKSLKPGEK